MAVDPVDQGMLYLHSLRIHVLEPLLTAESIAVTERDELEAEQEAFAEFTSQIKKYRAKSTTPPSSSVDKPLIISASSPNESLSQVYRDTVMAVPHYDDVYGEPLPKNAVAELGSDVAALLFDSGTALTDLQYNVLQQKAERLVRKRASLGKIVEQEITNLRLMHEKLQDLVDELDSNTIPAWDLTEWERRLENIHEPRQEFLTKRTVPLNMRFCPYLYESPQWTYPVLTAVGRLTQLVSVRE